jgi:3-phenylpropionate/trans-cinnamate dioxygenase ferredoxin subunit
VFENDEDFYNLFVGKTAIVHKSFFGEVLLVKNKDGYHVFKNRCPHQNKPLNGCWTEDNHIVCPFHRYHFDIDSGQGHGTYVEKYEIRFTEGKVDFGKDKWVLF